MSPGAISSLTSSSFLIGYRKLLLLRPPGTAAERWAGSTCLPWGVLLNHASPPSPAQIQQPGPLALQKASYALHAGVGVRALPEKTKHLHPKPSAGWGYLPGDALHHQAARRREATSILSDGIWIYGKRQSWAHLLPDKEITVRVQLYRGCQRGSGMPKAQLCYRLEAQGKLSSRRKSAFARFGRLSTTPTDFNNIPTPSTDIRSKRIACSCGS